MYVVSRFNKSISEKFINVVDTYTYVCSNIVTYICGGMWWHVVYMHISLVEVDYWR